MESVKTNNRKTVEAISCFKNFRNQTKTVSNGEPPPSWPQPPPPSSGSQQPTVHRLSCSRIFDRSDSTPGFRGTESPANPKEPPVAAPKVQNSPRTEIETLRSRNLLLERDRAQVVDLQKRFIDIATENVAITLERDAALKEVKFLKEEFAAAKSRIVFLQKIQNDENSAADEIRRLQLDLQESKLDSEKFAKLFDAETKRRQAVEAQLAAACSSKENFSTENRSECMKKDECGECVKKDEKYLQLREQMQELMAEKLSCDRDSMADDNDGSDSR